MRRFVLMGPLALLRRFDNVSKDEGIFCRGSSAWTRNGVCKVLLLNIFVSSPPVKSRYLRLSSNLEKGMKAPSPFTAIVESGGRLFGF